MIGKIVIGKDFYGVLAYNEKKISEGNGYVLDCNIEHSTSADMTREFNLIRQLRPGLGKAVFHVSLNLPYTDHLDDKAFISLGCDYLMKMGFDNNQFIMYRHTDTQHEHIHIIANRIRYCGKLVSDSHIKRRSREILNDLEKKYGLTQISKTSSAKKSLTQKEIEKTLRTGHLPIKLILQKKIDSVISRSTDTKEFITLLQKQNISPKFNVSKTTGRVSGISFRYQDVVYKGSTLGKKFSWNRITKQIDYEQTRDHSLILWANGEEQATYTTDQGNHGTAIKTESGNYDLKKSTKNSFRQSKAHLGEIKGHGVVTPLENETEWTPFKLELTDYNTKKKSKRKKKRRGFNL